MRIDLNPPRGGVLIEGTSDELQGLAFDLQSAAEWESEQTSSLLTSDGVETVTIRCLDADGDGV